MRVVATPVNGGVAHSDSLLCESGSGTTTGIPAGTYNVTVDLVAGAGELSATQRFTNVTIRDRTNTPLGALEFVVSTRGGFSLRLDSSANGGNCAGAPGAYIVDVRVQLFSANAACVPTSFAISDGAMQRGGAYVVSNTCQEAWGACIENDQRLSVVDLSAGSYSLVAVGVEQDANGARHDCYFGTGTLVVPGGDLVDDQGTITIVLDANNTNCLAP